jgi:adenylate cyclase
MERDEAGTLANLKSLRTDVFEPRTRAHGGRIFKIAGDGALCEFASAVDAVRAALEVQRALAERNAGLPEDCRIALRIGIALGDVIAEGGDLYGHGVNLAARIEGLAEPGSVCVAANVAEHLQVAGGFAVADLGEHQVKNIERPIHVFALNAAGAPASAPVKAAKADAKRVYICVLPFANMSGDQEQEYFSDGITEDIITDLSKVSALAVISRNSAFMYKEKHVDVPKVARELKASHVLEGSVRKAGGRLRISAQLIDGATNSHIWAERYDRDTTDIFAIQDEISLALVNNLRLKIGQGICGWVVERGIPFRSM